MAADRGRARDLMAVGVGAALSDGGRHSTSFRIDKWDLDQTRWVARKSGIAVPRAAHFAALKVAPFDVTQDDDCNLITNAGWNLLLKGKTLLSTDTAPTIWYDSTHGRIGVGSSATAPTAADTALNSVAGFAGNNWILCGAAPTVGSSLRTAIFTATFGTADGNGTWLEFAIDQGTASAASVSATAPMLNHGLLTTSTKNNTQTWAATATLTFT